MLQCASSHNTSAPMHAEAGEEMKRETVAKEATFPAESEAERITLMGPYALALALNGRVSASWGFDRYC